MSEAETVGRQVVEAMVSADYGRFNSLVAPESKAAYGLMLTETNVDTLAGCRGLRTEYSERPALTPSGGRLVVATFERACRAEMPGEAPIYSTLVMVVTEVDGRWYLKGFQ
jgi:hypothetical protein